ncbi:MAG: DUF4080 domain-containing protein [Clostridia bacterium]|nr:DUF4080 domain-containing protein [Clostridia bacterium]
MLNSKYIHSSLAPWYLYSGVRAFCNEEITVSVIESTVNEKTEKIISRLCVENADLYAFCCYIWNIEAVKTVAEEIKNSTGALIVFGGPEVSYNADFILKNYGFVDFVLSGEGDESFPALCNCIYKNGDFSQIKGLCYRENDKIFISEPVVSDKEPLSPYCDEYFNKLNSRITYIEASRGCPFSCAFCLSGRCGKLVLFDIERVKREILLLAKSGTQTVKFIDRTFNAKPERADEIISFIIENYGKEIPVNVCFHFEIDGGTLKDSTLKLLKSAPVGLFQLEVGLQSFNPDTLRAVHRNPDTTKLENTLKELISAGNMHIHADLIAGLPYENIESFRNSFNRLYELKPHMLQLGFLKLLHGSELREKSEEFTCIYHSHAPYEVISTDCLSEEDMQALHYTEDAVDRLYNSGRFRKTLEFLIDECNIEPFELFLSFGRFTSCKSNIPLDEYIGLVYNFFGSKTDKSRLRDMLVCDRLSSNASGIIPSCLKIPDSRLKRIKKHLSENMKLGGKTACAILYSENKVVYCDYKHKNPVTENYELSFMEIDL